MLHIGPYDEEPESFSIMEDYCAQNYVNINELTNIDYRELAEMQKIAW